MKWDSSTSINETKGHVFSESMGQLLGGYRDASIHVESEEDLMSSPPSIPNVHNFNLPLLGRVQFVQDIAGFIQWSIIVSYWVYGNWSTWLVILLPHYYDGQMSILMLFSNYAIFIMFLLQVYAFLSVSCIVSFIRASTTNPGSLINGQQPMEDWTICGKCCRRRPPMSHHCRRCNQCVRKMDHHCPWINNCVGEDNQYSFMLLLAYAYTLSLTTLVLDIMHMYYMPHCFSCDKESFMIRHESGIIWTAIVMAVMMSCGAAGLYMSQHISIVFDTPSIEWMRLQHLYFTAGASAIKWPVQTRSVFGAYRATFGEGSWYLWPFPCRRRRAVMSYHV